MLHTQVKGILANPEVLKTAPHPTIFHELMSGRNGAPVLKPIALEDEAQLMVVAGTDTSSNTLTIATAHVLDNPKMYARLRDELQNAWPTLDETPRYEDLEKLPYLVCPCWSSLYQNIASEPCHVESGSEGGTEIGTWRVGTNVPYCPSRWSCHWRHVYSGRRKCLVPPP